MKHDLKITALLLLFFVVAQVVGLALINTDIKEVKTVDGVTKLVHEETSMGPRPEMSGLGAFAYILIGITIGTLLVLLIIKTGSMNLWKIWFFLAVFVAISLALGVLSKSWIVFVIAFILALLKSFKPNIIIHNTTEVLMYSGLAIFLVPMLNVFWMIILLFVISIYDFIAVYKSKHMVKMAQFQSKSKLFSGLFIPYTSKDDAKKVSISVKSNKKVSKEKLKKIKVPKKHAILGGGDIAFPLLFAGTVMEGLIIKGIPGNIAFFQSLIITVTTTIALGSLFVFAKKDKFYPAMPIVTAGCLVGYLIVLIL